MKTFKLDASKIEFEGNPFTGSINVKIPNVKERMDIFKEMDLSKVVGADVSVETGLELFSKMADFVESVDLTCNGESITDVDELTCFSEGTQLFQSLGQYIMNGLPLGNDLRLR